LRFEVAQNLQTTDRPLALGDVGVIAVHQRQAGRGAVRLLEPDDPATKTRALSAGQDLHRALAGVVVPDAEEIGRLLRQGKATGQEAGGQGRNDAFEEGSWNWEHAAAVRM